MQAALCIKLGKKEILHAKYIFNINASNQTQLFNSNKYK